MNLINMDDMGDMIFRMSDHTTDPNRPFTGQRHTFSGTRGKTKVKGIRFRDLTDCVVKALVDVAGSTVENVEEMRRRADDGTLNHGDVYDLDLSQIDPLALAQSINCRVEKAMGIYPNCCSSTGLEGVE